MNAIALIDRTEGTSLDAEAEMAVLGTVIFENSVYPSVAHLRPETFAEPLHAEMWTLIGEIITAGGIAEPVALSRRLTAHPAFDAMGGISYLADLIDRAPPPSAVAHYAGQVMDAMIRRQVAGFGQAVANRASKSDGFDAGSLLSDVRRALTEIETGCVSDDASMISAPEAAGLAVAEIAMLAETGRTRGRMTGLRCVDRRLGGLRPGALLVVGGRPSMGKTSLARAIMSGAADRNPIDQFLFLGIEMSPAEMMQRELSARAFVAGECVEYRSMGEGKVTPMDIAALRQAQMRVPANLRLDDCHSLSLEDVRRKVWSVKRKGPLGAVAIDYLQLMRRPPAAGRNDATVLGELTAGLKLVARQAETTIILLSQLSRAVENRDDKRPQLSDLRESGSIEQDADAVLFPYREFYYHERSEPKENTTQHDEWEALKGDLRTRLDVICGKQRQGPVGTDRQTYHAEYDHIEDHKD